LESRWQRAWCRDAADLEARGVKLEKTAREAEASRHARRRVMLGLILGESLKSHELGAKPEQVGRS